MDPLTAFYPSAVRTMAAAQMSQYNSGQGGHLTPATGGSGSSAPYASIFAAAAAAATAVTPDPFSGPFRTRVEVRDLRSAMLHHYQHHSQYHPVSSTAFMIDRPPSIPAFNSKNTVKVSSDTGSLSPSTDGDSIAEPLMCSEDSPPNHSDPDHKTPYSGHLFDTVSNSITSRSKLESKATSDILDHSSDSPASCPGAQSTAVATSKKARLSKSVSKSQRFPLSFSPFNLVLASIESCYLQNTEIYSSSFIRYAACPPKYQCKRTKANARSQRCT